METFARRLRCTEGQLYTVFTGAVVAMVLGWSGISALAPQQGFLPVASPPAAATPAAALPTTAATPAVGVPPASAPVVNSPGRPGAAAAGSFAGTAPADAESTPAQVSESGADTVAPPSLFARIGDPGAPAGIAVAPDGRVFVATDNGSGRGVEGPSHLFGFTADGAPSVDVTITGQPDGHVLGLSDVAVGSDGSVVVLDASTARVLRIEPDAGSQTVVATVPDVLPCVLPVTLVSCEPGMEDHAPLLTAAEFDGDGNLFVADAGQATVWKVTADGVLQPWYQSAEFANGGPAGLALDVLGNVFVTVTTTTDAQNNGKGGLYTIARNGDGTAGARTLVTSFAAVARPGAVAVGPTGTAYVVVRATGTIVEVTSTGTAPMPTDGTPVPIDSPAGLAVSGDRLLVTNGADSDEPGRWAVLSLTILLDD